MLGFDPLHNKTRKEIFLEEMNQAVPWAALVALIQPHSRGAHQALGGRPPFAVETMLRIHSLQLGWNLSDPAMEEELRERPLYREFAGLSGEGPVARRDQDPVVSPTAVEASAGPGDFRNDQRPSCGARAHAQDRYADGCHADCRAQFDQ
ncbi:transposase [Xanthomonas sp. NCPPB 1067]|uniref:transposase n=1 Tax=Xanthomonas sp. NCPPB 1067 TaxID=487524 RepID=UPI003F885D99